MSITTVGGEQHGVVSRAQLVEAGATDDQIRHWRRTGRLRDMAPRAYAIAGSPRSWMQQLSAGVLSLGRGRAWVSHDAAARLHDFDRTPADRVEFTVLREHRSTNLAAVVHSTSTLAKIDQCVIDGLPVTSATRTIIDLARARVSTARLEAAIDTAVRTGVSAPVVIDKRLSALRGPGRWGCRRIDELLLDAGGHTMLERRFLALVRHADLPRPRTQAVIRRGGRTVARADFLYPEYLIVVEVSGRRGHSSPSERAKDAQRRNELQDMGYTVYEYTWEQVTRGRARVAALMRERLLAAGWRPPTTASSEKSGHHASSCDRGEGGARGSDTAGWVSRGP